VWNIILRLNLDEGRVTWEERTLDDVYGAYRRKPSQVQRIKEARRSNESRWNSDPPVRAASAVRVDKHPLAA